MTNELHIRFAGQDLYCLAERALWWPSRSRLIISDLHMGKDEVFRRAGIAVPRGVLADDLARLASVIERTQARALWIAGDMTHNADLRKDWLQSWNAFRDRFATVNMLLIRGNHDRSLAVDQIGVDSVSGWIEDGLITIGHDAPAFLQGHSPYSITGHVHPVVKISGLPKRWPVFRLRKDSLTLPAFSYFTGGFAIDRGDEWVACVGDQVIDGRQPDSATHVARFR